MHIKERDPVVFTSPVFLFLFLPLFLAIYYLAPARGKSVVILGISYIVDVWRQDTPPTKSLFDFAAFITLFPHLIAGPVLRYKDLAWQFQNRRHGLDNFSEGAYRFMLGFAKKVLIADIVAPLAD